MKAKDTTIILLLLIIAVLCYFIGFHFGARRQDQKQEAQGRLATDLGNYIALRNGDAQHTERNMRMQILSEVRVYDEQFGSETGTNLFARQYAIARDIALQTETQLMSGTLPDTLVHTNSER